MLGRMRGQTRCFGNAFFDPLRVSSRLVFPPVFLPSTPPWTEPT